MKRYFISLMLVLITTSAYSQFSYQEILHLSWGDGDHEAGFRKAPGGQFGPMSFAVQNDTIFLLDTQNKCLKIFKQESLLAKENLLLNYADDFIREKPNHYLLLANNALYQISKKDVNKFYTPDSPQTVITSLNSYNGEKVAELNEGNSIQLENGKNLTLSKNAGIVDRYGNSVKIIKKDWHTISVKSDHFSFNITSHDQNFGAVRFLGRTPDGALFIYLEKIIKQVPLQIEREIRLYNQKGDAEARFLLPKHSYTDVFKEFYVDAHGDLYHMVTTENGVYIINWHQTGDAQQNSSVYRYPERFFNHQPNHQIEEKKPFKEKSSEKKLKKKDLFLWISYLFLVMRL